MANEVLKYLSELYRLVTVQDDYTTASQISAVVCNMESLLFPCNGVAPHGSDLDVYMSNIFNPDNGLPAFITKYFHVKTIRPCFDLMFGLILKLLLEYNRRVVQYVAIIKDVCMKAILSGDTTAQCKAKCYACLEKIITSLPGNFSLQSELNAEVLTNQLFNHLAMSRSKLQTTDVHSIYTIFGLLGKDFSSELCAPDKLIRAVCNELNSKEVKAGTAKIKIVESCLTALSNLLSNPEFKSLVLANSSHQSKIYSALKSTLVPNKRVHTAFRACLKLFADHTDVFSSLLIPEYALWHSQLTELLSNFEGEEDNRAIEEALDKFYVHVATFVSEQGGIQSVAIYKYFMEYFEKEMASLSTLRSTNVSGRNKNKLTIKGLSRFVECNVAGNDASRQHLGTMFHAFLKRTLYLSLELQRLEQSSLESNARLVSHYVFLLSHLLAKVTTQGTSTQVPGTQGGAGTLGSGTQGISSRESGIPGSSSQRISTKGAINTEDIFTQDPATQGISTQGVGTQGTSTQRTGNQGHRTLGTSTQGPGTSGTGTQGISTGTEGFITQGPTIQGPITQGPSTQVSTQSWNSFLSICLNLVSLYPRLDYRTAAEVSSELTQSLVSLWKKCGCDGAVNGLVREFVYQSVIQTCSHDLAFDADNLPNQSLITYRAYLPLWRHLLSRTETLCDDGSSFGDVIVNELMTSLLIFCHKLDLGANLKPDSELSNSTFLPSLSHAYLGDPASHLSPSNQDDLTLFTNLVDFYTDLLTKQGAYTGRPPNTTLPPNSDSENSALPLNSAENSGLPPNFDPENAALPLNTNSSVRPMNTTSENTTLPPNSGNTTLSPNSGNTTLSPNVAFLPLNSTENPAPPINTTGNLASNFASPDRGNSAPPILSAGSARVVAVLSEIVGASMRHPVVSGLYSLSGLMLRLARAQGCFEDPALVKHLSPVLESYLDQVIHMSINQQHQLRFVCLSLILATPLCFIRPVLPRLVQPFKIIFELGLNDLDLAETGMSVLTYWVSHLSPHTMADFIAPLLPCMNPYLKSRDSVRDAVFYSEADRDILLSRSNTRSNKLAHIKKKKYIESYEQTSQLRNVQTSIVYFLSLLDSNLASQIVSREGNRENLSEACSQRLLFNVPYVTAKIPIYLDVFMDRIISLGSSSSNRRMRVSACEFLHSTTLLLLGNNKQDGSRKGSERDEMFEKMFPVLIKLGCDSDILIRQLFADLSIQMMHYYSSEIQLCTSHAQFVITTLMECITQDSDTELRSFASRLLSELIVWSRKQSKCADLVRDTKLNMAAVVKQIQQFCVHPHPSKRIGELFIYYYGP
ncbi:hypothetical protein M8J75_016085 [Diaphorina citri]|nr:hypothetical protein M8J75_016085 [Diaphorina citri]